MNFPGVDQLRVLRLVSRKSQEAEASRETRDLVSYRHLAGPDAYETAGAAP